MHRLLILTANPKNLAPLQLGKEVRDIEEGLKRTPNSEKFQIISRFAVRPRDLQRAVLEVKPHMIHFSGHGEENVGLYIEDVNGCSIPITGTQLANLFRLASKKSPIKCVVLNGCYSAEQAEIIAKHVPYVVGMQRDIDDRAAIEFSVGFYDAIWKDESVEFAVESGKVAAQFTSSQNIGEPILHQCLATSNHEDVADSVDQRLVDKSKKTERKIVLLSAHSAETQQSIRQVEISKIDEAVSRASMAVIRKGNSLPMYEEPLDKSNIGASELSTVLSTIEPSIIDISGSKCGLSDLLIQGVVDLDDVDDLVGDFFRVTSEITECVVLNGCYVENQARKIVQHTDFLVGIEQEISHDVVLMFIKEFYYQIGIGLHVQQAYGVACNLIRRSGIEKSKLPILLSRKKEENRKELLRVEKKIKEAPENAELRAKKGDLLEDVGEHEEAALAYDKSLYIDGKDYRIWWKLGKALVKVEKYSEAQKPYLNALKLRPELQDECIISREYGLLLCLLGKPNVSIGMYKKSLWLDPRYRVANYEKRKLYKQIYSKGDQKPEK